MKLLDYPDGLAEGSLSVVADFLRGRGDKVRAAQNAWHAQGYFQGMFLGSYQEPQIVGAVSPHAQATRSVAAMSNEEMASFLERAGEKKPQVVGSSGVAMANQGFNLLQILAIIRKVMDLLFPSGSSPDSGFSTPGPMPGGSMFSPSQPAMPKPEYPPPGGWGTPQGTQVSSDEQGHPVGGTPPGPPNRPDTAGYQPPQQPRQRPGHRSGQDEAKAPNAEANPAAHDTENAEAKPPDASPRKQTGNAG